MLMDVILYVFCWEKNILCDVWSTESTLETNAFTIMQKLFYSAVSYT